MEEVRGEEAMETSQWRWRWGRRKASFVVIFLFVLLNGV